MAGAGMKLHAIWGKIMAVTRRDMVPGGVSRYSRGVYPDE